MSAVRTEARKLLSLSIPVMVTQAGTMLLGVVDTVMVGQYQSEALGAASLGHLWTMGTMIFGLGIIFGMDPIVSQAHGRGDPATMARTLQRGVVLAMVLSLPIGCLWWFAEPALIFLKQDPALSQSAQSYSRVQVFSLPAFLVFNALRQYLQGRGIVRPALIVVVAANLVNAGLNWCFIYGRLGFPEMGVTGAGLATGITRVFLLLALLALIWVGRLHQEAWIPWSRQSLRFAGFRDVLLHGIPVGLQYGLEVWAFQIATILAGWLGKTQLGAHSIVLNLASLSFMLPLGISIGTVTRVGNLVGERRFHRAQLAAWVAMALGASVMAGSACLFVLGRSLLPSFYSTDQALLQHAIHALPIAGAFQLFDGIQVVGGGVLRGMGRTRPAAVFNLLGYYVLALPLSYWLAFTCGQGLAGIWWGLCLGLGVVALLLVAWIWKRGPNTLRSLKLPARRAIS